MPGEGSGHFDTKEYCVILGEADQHLGMELTNALYRLEFAVMHCSTGREIAGWAHLCKRPYDRLVIVSETRLPDIPGPEVCRRIRGFGPDFEGIMMFGMSENPADEAYWSGLSPPGTFIEISGPDIPLAVCGKVIQNIMDYRGCQPDMRILQGHRRYG